MCNQRQLPVNTATVIRIFPTDGTFHQNGILGGVPPSPLQGGKLDLPSFGGEARGGPVTDGEYSTPSVQGDLF